MTMLLDPANGCEISRPYGSRRVCRDSILAVRCQNYGLVNRYEFFNLADAGASLRVTMGLAAITNVSALTGTFSVFEIKR